MFKISCLYNLGKIKPQKTSNVFIIHPIYLIHSCPNQYVEIRLNTTLKSERDSIRSSSSLVAFEADAYEILLMETGGEAVRQTVCVSFVRFSDVFLKENNI